MARSSLFTSLAKMAQDHAEASRRGIAVDAVRDERRAGMSRRGFLGALGAAAAVSALPACIAPSDSASEDSAATKARAPRIVVVGAGISGLAAALALADAKLAGKLTVYESSNRIGGRMFSNTEYWDDGQCTEWCGELIDSSHATILKLAQRYGIAVDDLPPTEPAGSAQVSYFDGAYYTQDQMNADFVPVFAAIQADAKASVPDKKADGSPNTDQTVMFDAITSAGKALDRMSVYDWIEAKVPGGHRSKMGRLLDMAYCSELGADTKQQSALNLVLLLSGLATAAPFAPFGASDERFHIRGGNQKLPVAIAADLRARLGEDVIRMNSRLIKVEKKPNGQTALRFAVTSRGATTYEDVIADYAILTLPFAILAEAVDYSDAGFDERKVRAIKEQGRGMCSKLQLQFSERLWNTRGAWGINNGDETFSDNGNQCSWHVTRGQPGKSGILNGFSGGSATQARADVANVAFGKTGVGPSGEGIAALAKTFLAQLEQIFPGITPLYTGKATLSLPHLDKNMGLSYSFYKVGQYTAFAGYERVPQGNVFFGGEHTSVNFQGFMEGGAAEGQRAAGEVAAAHAAAHRHSAAA